MADQLVLLRIDGQTDLARIGLGKRNLAGPGIDKEADLLAVDLPATNPRNCSNVKAMPSRYQLMPRWFWTGIVCRTYAPLRQVP